MPVTTTDVMAAKVAVQLGLVKADDARAILRAQDLEPKAGPDFVNRITVRFGLLSQVVETVRHRVALYEHVRAEAVYLRLVEKDLQVPHQSVVNMLAQLESSPQRPRLGTVLVKKGKLTKEQDRALIDRARSMIEKDDQKILERYRGEDFAGAAKPLIRGSSLDPSEFKISTLFRSKETRALVDQVDLERLREEARRVHAERERSMGRSLDAPTPVATSGPTEADTKFREPAAKAPAEPPGSGLGMDQVKQLKRIDDYTIVETLGAGGMGAVFLGQKDGRGEYVAIKVMLNLMATPLDLKKFKREIELTRRVKHPGVIAVLDAGETPQGLTYMVVPALAGKELRNLIDATGGHGLTPPIVRRYFSKVCDAMQAVHDAGVVHRDMKPENIFIRAGGEDVIVMDFGLAKPAKADYSEADMYQSAPGEVVGSPMYIAPESVSNDPVDARTDIYSMGCVLFEMLTGKLPLESETTQGFLSQHLICPPATLAEARPEIVWPEKLEALLAKMMGKSKEERPASCNEVKAEFEAAMDGFEKKAPPTMVLGKPVEEPPAPVAAAPAGKQPFGFKGLLGRMWGGDKS